MSIKSILVLLAIAAGTLSAAPIRTMSGLTGVTFYELTSTATPFTFGNNSSEMTTRLSSGLNASNRDFFGTPNEHYDVYYSDSNGAFNIDGEYISIEAYYAGNGIGLNIGEVELLFGSGPSAFATSVASLAAGTGYIAGSENNILDGNINTATGMGSNDESRMRVTVGFVPAPSNEVPEPSSFILGALGVAGILGFRARRR